MEDYEGEKYEHQKVVNKTKVANVDQLWQPPDELVQDGIAEHPAIERQTRQDLHENQQVDDEVGEGRQRIVTNPVAGAESHEKIELDHVPHAFPLLAVDGNVGGPLGPEITLKEPVNSQQHGCDQNKSRDHMNESHLGHQEGRPPHGEQKRPVHVQAGEGK